jgi:protein-disulfide isomerase
MLRFFRAMLLATMLPAGAMAAGAGAGANSTPSFTPAQRSEIISIVRQALQTDPSILRDAITTLQADEAARDAAEAKNTIVAKQKDLLANPGYPEAGNPHGDVTVVEFYDPRCPYCKRMLPGIEAMLQKDHGVRLVYKDIPVLGPPSVMEARAILAAQNQGAYLKMQAALMKDPGQPSEALIRATATNLGLDADKLVADMNGPQVTQRLHANLALMKDLKLQGTPAFVVGDQLIPGMVDADQLEAAVTGARKHA